MILGYRIRLLRKQNNMSQEKLGKMLGVSKVSVSGYENGTRVPSMYILNKILTVFNISADYLLGREVNVVYENDKNESIAMSNLDINIILEFKKFPNLYNSAIRDPKRFFASIYKKDI